MRKANVIIASILGNALEFYNLTLHGVFASILGNLFFPSSDPTVSLIASLSTFAAGFCMRPLGAIIFGRIGDRLGRKRALSLSIIIMGIPTFLIGCLPGYEVWGIWAPICLVTARLIQGTCAGGEYNGATIFALEHVGKNYPGLVGGFIVGSCLLGMLIALIVGMVVLLDGMPDYAWRWAFMLGGLTSLFGLYVRRKIAESPDFMKISHVERTPLKRAITNNLASCGKVFSIAAFDGATTYTLAVFLVVFMQQNLGIAVEQALHINLIGIVTCMVGCPLMGWIADKYGVRRSLITATILTLACGLPIFWMMATKETAFMILAHILLGLSVASIIGMQPLYSQKLFPTCDRYTGISTSYSIGLGIVGGFTPAVLTWLSSYDLTWPGFYIMAFSIGFLIILLKTPTSKS
jgi:MFS transporter, MHS family, proline/betaine transporter